MSGRPPQPEKAEVGGPFLSFVSLCLTIRARLSIIKLRKGAGCTVVSSLSQCHILRNMTAGVWKTIGAVISFCAFFLCILVLDNPRTTVYNKDKERRYPCKRLAPHQSSITKVMTATGLGVLGGHFFLCFFLLLP